MSYILGIIIFALDVWAIASIINTNETTTTKLIWIALVAILPVVALTGMCFGAIGLCFNALARSYDFFTYYFTLIMTPMIFLSGVYYPVSELPDWLAPVAQALPLAAAVKLARPLVIGEWPAQVWPALATLLAYAGVGLYLALILTRRRFAA